MKKVLSFLLLLFILPVAALPQSDTEWIYLQEPVAKFKKAKGWYCNERGSWYSKKNEIFDFDHFKRYEIGMAYYRGETYVYLRKYWEKGLSAEEADGNRELARSNWFNWLDTSELFRTQSYVYFFEYDQYKTLINGITDGENTLIITPALITYNASDLNKVAARIAVDSKDTFVFRILVGEKRKTTRFLFFDTVDGRVNPFSFRTKDVNNKIAYDLTETNQQLFWSSDMFDHFFYETSYNDLTKFLQAPLKIK
jgi:hypothetical protein